MIFLRSNTAVIIAVGPFYDKADGVTIETALTITNERITLIAETDAGSAPTLILDNITGATAATANDLNYIASGDNGMMQIELAAADVNRVGRMKLSITDAANHVPVFHEFFVLPAALYDWLTGVIVPLPANVTTWLGTAAATPTVAGVPEVDLTHVAGATTDVSALATNVAAILVDTGTTLQAELDGIEADVDAILVDTGTTLQAELDAIQAAVITNAAGVDIAADIIALKAETVEILADTAEIGAAGAGLTAINLPNQTMDIVGNITGNLSGSVGSVIGAVGSVTGAVGSVTGAVGSIAANGLSASSLAADAVDEILDEQIGDGTVTMRQALRVLIAGMAGKLSGAATTTVTIRNLADSADVVVATVDADGNRSATTVTP